MRTLHHALAPFLIWFVAEVEVLIMSAPVPPGQSSAALAAELAKLTATLSAAMNKINEIDKKAQTEADNTLNTCIQLRATSEHMMQWIRESSTDILTATNADIAQAARASMASKLLEGLRKEQR